MHITNIDAKTRYLIYTHIINDIQGTLAIMQVSNWIIPVHHEISVRLIVEAHRPNVFKLFKYKHDRTVLE